jgi:hypothetical protein
MKHFHFITTPFDSRDGKKFSRENRRRRGNANLGFTSRHGHPLRLGLTGLDAIDGQQLTNEDFGRSRLDDREKEWSRPSNELLALTWGADRLLSMRRVLTLKFRGSSFYTHETKTSNHPQHPSSITFKRDESLVIAQIFFWHENRVKTEENFVP